MGLMPSRSLRSRTRTGWRAAVMAGLFVGLASASATAQTLAVPPGEEAALNACEKKLCAMILGKEPAGSDLACDLQKTWAKSSLEGGKSKGVSWSFGDARCSVDLRLQRKDIVAALTQPKHTVRVPAHEVNCILERDGEIKPVKARLAPKLTFKDGKADKVWINLENIEGPDDVKSTIWTAAQLEDKLGIFHRPMIKSINKFLYRQCAKRYGPDGEEAKADGGEKKTKVAADKHTKPTATDAPTKASTAGP